MDDLRAILFSHFGVDVMQGLRTIGIGLFLFLGLGCHNTEKQEPVTMPSRLPEPELSAALPGRTLPAGQSSQTKPTPPLPNPQPTTASMIQSPPGLSDGPGSSMQSPIVTPPFPDNPANFRSTSQATLPVTPPPTSSHSYNDLPQPPRPAISSELHPSIDGPTPSIRMPSLPEMDELKMSND